MSTNGAVDTRPTVQTFSPTLAEEAQICTFYSYPSGSILIRTVPQTDFATDGGLALMNSLSDAVENILGEGIAVAAAGEQGLDVSGLIYDAVTFTVEYVPPTSIPGRIIGNVTIPVQTLTLDTSIAGGSGVPGITTAPELILAEYNALKKSAGG